MTVLRTATLGRGAAIMATAAATVVFGASGWAGAAPSVKIDPDDTSLRVDLKSVSHSDDGASVSYTVEAYDDFPDQWADFKFGIDRDGDESFDLIVFAEWEPEDGELVAGVDDVTEEPVGTAMVSRPTKNSLTVTFSRRLLGQAEAVRYGVAAGTDLNGNGEEDEGEIDVAPDGGLLDQQLSPATGTGGGTGAPAPAPERTQAAGPSMPDTAVGPIPAEPGPGRTTALPRTGPAPILQLLAGLLFTAGGFCIVVDGTLAKRGLR